MLFQYSVATNSYCFWRHILSFLELQQRKIDSLIDIIKVVRVLDLDVLELYLESRNKPACQSYKRDR